MVLNPAINENNLWKQIGLDYDENYIPELMDLSKRESNWTRYNEAMFYHPENSGAEVMGILPKWDCAQKKLCQFIKTSGYVSYTDALKIVFSRTSFSRPTSLLLKTIIRFCTKPFQKSKLQYPLVGGYSDIFLINRESLDDFIKYIGAFAATRLFVEIAIPTALCLSSEKLKTEKELRKSGEVYWNDDITAFGEKYSFSLAQLFKDFNPNTFYIHPVKLSKWK
jgi:hypothetical protein